MAVERLSELRASAEGRKREERAEATCRRLGTLKLTPAQERLLYGEASSPKGASAATTSLAAQAAPTSNDVAEGSAEPAAPASTAESPPSATAASKTLIPVNLSFKGKASVANVSSGALGSSLFDAARRAFQLPTEKYQLKLLYKGKVFAPDAALADVLGVRCAVYHDGVPTGAAPKVMVMASAAESVAAVRDAVSDPSVPSFAAEHGSRKGRVPTSKGVPATSFRGPGKQRR